LIADSLFILAGLVLLFFGGEGLVRGAVAIADRFGISKLIVGMVIVGFGTSAPELLVSVQAALSGSPDIAIGNVVGSNIANVLLILGIAALIAPVPNCDRAILRDALVMVAASVWLVALLRSGAIGEVAGGAMLAALAAYLGATYWQERRRQATVFEKEAEEVTDLPLSAPMAWGAVLLGLVFLVLGARFLVEGATGIARLFGVSEAVIGLTIVAVGTSLPELATGIVAALRRHAEVVLANVIGSNIFNILCILGVTSLIAPVPVALKFAALDGPVMLGVAGGTALLLIAVRTLGRPLGLVLLAGYALYVGVQAVT